jgi:hypothetical protein
MRVYFLIYFLYVGNFLWTVKYVFKLRRTKHEMDEEVRSCYW